MKVRVKATGEIVEVEYIGNGKYSDGRERFEMDELYFNIDDYDLHQEEARELEMIGKRVAEGLGNNSPDYWTRLEHQYAGMAMQGILANIDLLMSLAKKKADDYPAKYTVAEFAKDCAHALVEKMKEEKIALTLSWRK